MATTPGVYQIPEDLTERAVSNALAAGYRSLDTAAAYQNEEAVGRAIRNSGIARDELFITTKLWSRTRARATTGRAYENPLHRLGLDTIDLYLMHQPYGDYYSQWRAMQDLHAEGHIRAIGVSNFHSGRLIDLITHNDITRAVNQIETHPFYQRQEEHAFMREHSVQHESWGPFATDAHRRAPTFACSS